MAYDPLLSHTLAQLGAGIAEAGRALAESYSARRQLDLFKLQAALQQALQEKENQFRLQALREELQANKEIFGERRKMFYDLLRSAERDSKERMQTALEFMRGIGGDSGTDPVVGKIMAKIAEEIDKATEPQDLQKVLSRYRLHYELKKEAEGKNKAKQMARRRILEEGKGLEQAFPGFLRWIPGAYTGWRLLFPKPKPEEKAAAAAQVLSGALGQGASPEDVAEYAGPAIAQAYGVPEAAMASPVEQRSYQRMMMLLGMLQALGSLQGRSIVQQQMRDAAGLRMLEALLQPSPYYQVAGSVIGGGY